MASISDTERSEWRGFGITGQGMRCDAEWGVAAGMRSDGVAVDPVAVAIEAHDGMRTVGSVTISGLELTGSGARDASGDGALRVDLGRPDRDEPTVLLVEEQGRYTWIVPEAGAQSVELPVEVTLGSRGGLGPIRRIVRFVAIKTAGRAVRHVSNTVVGAWDERRHPFRVRSWSPDDHRSPDALEPNFDTLLGGPALLVIHGFTGSIHGSFRFEDDVVDSIYRAYGGRTFAFDHPTLAVTPQENAVWLGDKLRKGMTIDVLAHSRGGLVARELARIARAREVDLRSITFVATPNDGTPLGDPDRPMGLIDALTNLVGALPGTDGLEMVLELLKDVVLKSALEGLTGLVAMKPGSSVLEALNADPVPESLVVRSISADYAPVMNAGIVKTAQDRLMDAYFGGVRNDRIVPTLSTIVTAGQFRVPAGQRLVLDSSRSVDHSTFWANDRAVRQLRDWLRPDWPERPPAPVPLSEAEPLAEVALPPDPLTIGRVGTAFAELTEAARKGVEELLGGPVNPNATPPTGARRAVVVVPGIMGTHLRRKSTGQIIWIDPLRLARGHFAELLLPPADGPAGEIEAAGLNRTYLPLISQLAAEEWDVYLADFDWRVDIFESGRRLASKLRDLLAADPKREIHLVAHSMGGLVARAMAVEDPDLWKELGVARRGSSGRLVMLGTPNGGSFAVPLILTGEETILKTLAFVDVRGRPEDLLNTVATFPGIYQMLPDAKPDDDDHSQLFDAATWGSRSPVSQQLLTGAREFHDRLRGFVDPDRMVYVAGYGHPTPFRLEVEAPGSFKIGRFLRGDGRVALELGQLEGMEQLYFSTGTHGGLPSAADVLTDIGELLTGGSVTVLKSHEPIRRGGPSDTPVMIAAEEFDAAPEGGGSRGGPADAGDWRDAEMRLGEALRLTVGGGSPQPSRPVVNVSVLNASLEQGRFPVVVGHYARLPQGGAEVFLDKKLGGALHARQRVGQYPERPGTALFLDAPKNRRPRGAIVLGLGELGTLTPQNLVAAMMQGVTAYVLDRREHDEDERGAQLGVSAVLVGTPGRRGINIEQCVAALVEGMILAVTRLNEPGRGAPIDRMELQIVELYEDAAEEAALAVDRLDEMLSPELKGQVQLLTERVVEEGDGRLAGAPPRTLTGTSWVRVTASLAPYEGDIPPALRLMKFSVLLRGAQSNLIDQELDLAQIRAYIDEAVRQPVGDSGVSTTLYEMLFPQRAKLDLDRTESLHLIVDEEMAEIPWELLSAAALYTDASPLALRAGILRQLQSEMQTRERSERPAGREVLVIGDPPTRTLPRLPGARAEASDVADLFGGQGWDVRRLIYSGDAQPGVHWMQIIDALNARPYRVVHIAAHGIFEESDAESRRSGVVIGAEPHHRITALNFRQMSVTPDLVFLNCCHLGRLGSFLDQAPEETRQAYQQPHRVAASLARQLLRNGVGAVVVAGWAVDDIAASAFATALYSDMLDGRPFGDAVRAARQAARAADFGRTTTWGAYQCYGDPDFELGTEDRPAPTRMCLVSPAQLARQFDMLATRAGELLSPNGRAWVFEQIERLRDEGGQFVADGRVLESLGRALSELGMYQPAIAAYSQALQDKEGRAHLWVIEQLVNLHVRLAVESHRETQADVTGQFKAAQTMLDSLDKLAPPTGERLALRGSLFKKWATTRPRGERDGDLASAARAYRDAYAVEAEGYPLNNWIQLQALHGPLDRKDAKALSHHLKDVEKRERDDPSPGYWETAEVADTLLTYAIAGKKRQGVSDVLKEAEARYETAFRLRSTVRQRDSVLDHLEDLRRVVPEDQANGYQGMIDTLTRVGEEVASD